MKTLAYTLPWILMFSLTNAVAGNQRSLDQACQAARASKLAPMRQQLVDECTEKKEKKDRASCERYYRDYGERSGTRAALFYDLPECVEAHNSKK